MDLKAIKQQLEIADFPKDTADAINNIISMAMTRGGGLTDEEIQEILNLIDDAIMKNKKETKQLLDFVDVIQDVQDEMIDAVEEIKQEQSQESIGNMSSASDSSATPTKIP